VKSHNPIKIIIADDHEFFRSGLAMVIKDNPSYLLLAEAEDGQDLIDKVNQHQPDIIIVDIEMPKLDGIQATRLIVDKNPLAKIIVLTVYDHDEVMLNALQAGALSFLDKNINKHEVYQTIDGVMASKTHYFPEKIAKKAYQLMEGKPKYASGLLKKDFSQRELEIISLESVHVLWNPIVHALWKKWR
jgi:DNA-binding NarL/FixJ family response regulator